MAEKNSGLVVKSNRLVEASYRMSLTEQQLVLYAIVDSREKQLGLFSDQCLTIDAKAFGKMFGIDQSHVFSMLKHATDQLFQRWIVIHDTHKKSGKPRTLKTRWIQDLAYIDGAGLIEITFANKVIPYITRLEKEFTQYRLEKVSAMSSAHAIRVYEMMRQYVEVGSREIGLDELKERLGVAGEYASIKDFKKRVLDVAVFQINAHSDIEVGYENKKTGRVVTGFSFTIKEKSPVEKKPVKKKTPVVNDAYIKKHARRGELYEHAKNRLMEELGQQRLID